jgi:pSer/pThr/pTyr-binding forkhead associated (FHA) protein
MISSELIQRMNEEQADDTPPDGTAALEFEPDLEEEDERTQLSVPVFADEPTDISKSVPPRLEPAVPPPIPPRHTSKNLPFSESGEDRTMVASPVVEEERTVVAESPVEDTDETEIDVIDKTLVAEPILDDIAKTVMSEPPPESAFKQSVGRLDVLMGPNEGQQYELYEGETYVGRSLECGVVLSDPSASRRHFRLVSEDGRFQLFDLGSENGTCVNGARVQQATLSPGAQISVGTTLLQYRPAGAAHQSHTSSTDARQEMDTNPGIALQQSPSGARWFVWLAIGLFVAAGIFVAGEFAFGWWSVFGKTDSGSGNVAASSNESTEDVATESESEARTDDNVEAATGDDGDDSAGELDSSEPLAVPPDAGSVAEADSGVTVASVIDEQPDAPTPDVLSAGEEEADGLVGEQDVQAVALDSAEATDIAVDGDSGEAPSDAETPDAEGEATNPDGEITDSVVAASDTGVEADSSAGELAAPDTASLVSATPDATALVMVDTGSAKDVLADANPFAEVDRLVAARKLDEAQAALIRVAQNGLDIRERQNKLMAARSQLLLVRTIERSVSDKKYKFAIILAGKIPQASPFRADVDQLVRTAEAALAPKEPSPDAGIDSPDGDTSAPDGDTSAPDGDTSATDTENGAPDEKAGAKDDAATAPQPNNEVPLEEMAADAAMAFVDGLTTNDKEAREGMAVLLATPEDCAKAPVAKRQDCVRSIDVRLALIETWVKAWEGKQLNEVTAPVLMDSSADWGELKQWSVTLKLADTEPTELVIVQLSDDRFIVWVSVELPDNPSEPSTPTPSAPPATP